MDTENETFDVLDFLQHSKYPTLDVVVFQDAKSAAAYIKAQEQRSKQVEVEDPDHPSELTKLIEELETKVRDSAIVFELQGLAPFEVQELIKDTGEDEEASMRQTNEIVARTIRGVRNSKGAYDRTPFTAERVASIRKNLKEGEFLKLVNGVTEVNLNAKLFDDAIDAGFPGRSADLG